MKLITASSLAFALLVMFLGTQAMGQRPAPPPSEVVVEGVVYDRNSKAGIAGLTVRLIPPRSATNTLLRILRTDSGGNFRFTDPDPNKYMGKCLLEVYDGTRQLFRREIDTSRPELRRVRIPVN